MSKNNVIPNKIMTGEQVLDMGIQKDKDGILISSKTSYNVSFNGEWIISKIKIK